MTTGIWWIRRDLRLADNPALQRALQECDIVIPLFILDPALPASPAPNRQAFLYAGLRSLDADLRELGSCLTVRSGNPADILPQVLAETGAEKIFAEEDYSPYAIQRDQKVSQTLPLQLVLGVTVHHPGMVVKPDGSPFRVFTAFSRTWKALPQPVSSEPKPGKLNPPPKLASEPIPGLPEPPGFPAGEKEAHFRLEKFLEQPVYEYANDRNRLDLDGTSTLSPYLRFGMISARQAFLSATKARANTSNPAATQGRETWINELIWREFYNAILYHFPFVLKTTYSPSFRNIPWREAPDDLHAWKMGMTGYPVVDACMRQLAGLGWMHNRGRMIVASFLVKDLLINWQEGERWFMKHLVDGDPAANNGGWQWTAGVGTDAAPYFRVFNPTTQGEKFDPEGRFIRKWVPELERVPTSFIHHPASMTLEMQKEVGVIIGRDYPAPMVDHHTAKERTLAAFKASSRIG